MPDYKLVSFKICPFVQRSMITLEEKQVPYEIEYIDLFNKPDWFMEVSPLGKVPILRVGDTVIFESAVINEYIEETAPGVALHPHDPLQRARHRAWIEVASEVLRKLYQLNTASDKEEAFKAAVGVRGVLVRFEDELGAGPFFDGPAFSLVDAAIASALQRLTWCEAIVPTLDLFSATPKVQAWRDMLLARQSVQRSTVPEIQELYHQYLQGRGSPSRAVEPAWLGTMVKNI